MNSFKSLVTPASSKSAGLFSGLAVTGVLATVVLTSQAAVKADKRIMALEKEEAPADVKIEETWKIYVPAAIAASATVLCILKASRQSRLRSEALLSAFIFEPFIRNEA